MSKLLTPEEAANRARERQLAKVAAVEAKRKARAAERESKRERTKLFAAHCADAAKALRGDDAAGAWDSLWRAADMLGAEIVLKRAPRAGEAKANG